MVAPALRKKRRAWWPFSADVVEELFEHLTTVLGRSIFDRACWSPTVPEIPLDEPPSADPGVQSLQLLQVRLQARSFVEHTRFTFSRASAVLLRRLGDALGEAVEEALGEGVEQEVARREFLCVVAGHPLERCEVRSAVDQIRYAMEPELSVVGPPLYLTVDTDGTVTMHGLKEGDRLDAHRHEDGAVSIVVSRGEPNGTRVVERFDFTAEEARRLRLPSGTRADKHGAGDHAHAAGHGDEASPGDGESGDGASATDREVTVRDDPPKPR